MPGFSEIKEHYLFSEREEETLKGLLPLVEANADRLTRDFYTFLRGIPETASFLQDETRLPHLRQSHRDWLLDLFRGHYDERYHRRLQRIGHAHVRIGLAAHYVYVAMNFIRKQLHGVIDTEVEPAHQALTRRALDKILDLNLDIIARTYHEEEMRRVFLSFKMDDALIRFARRFTFGLNLILVIGLLGLSFGAVAMIGFDISQIFFSGKFEKGVVAAMGSLLVLWLVIELLEAEIDRLRGGSFKLHLFVGVALVAFIREELVSSMSHTEFYVHGIYLGGILILGFIYWLISRGEAR